LLTDVYGTQELLGSCNDYRIHKFERTHSQRTRSVAVVYEAHAYCNLPISAQYFRNRSNR